MLTVALFVAVFIIAFGLGMSYGSPEKSPLPNAKLDPTSAQFIVYECVDGKSVWATYKNESVTLSLSDGSNVTLPHALSASGARYANADESFVFWNKGTTAFIEENGTATYSNCNQKDRTGP
ncbi:MAG: MliC family protein [Candidatus Paceibacterota bacterium]|jgi:membrane-bound inhibitor of C-type lysozyme